ncbi:uncharacterized protein YndB with AHSA1/START domain [Paenibacillus sp. V4I3]|uniref:SRPBCC family protein n=1 Tax=unclassified Paenibacillus TaxID=185978 RepID=UPI0027835815|nr:MULTISPECIES: SRPBCC domain-containing protein [unclassified Paenibacillus]MDQ0871755.1 uncharacterized protein YndB with AHSA1/START domain [Paenibacillus sp. V4I3]MDQ0892362.1 uncharacterized protein YndB with AHSA1/START domain [Paenibacillus sp. V4I9]
MTQEKSGNNFDVTLEGGELVLTRTFNAPRELVFKAWTEAEHLAHWWGPTSFELSVHTLDLRPGGSFHYCMKSAEGFEMWGKFVYHEINSPEKLVYVNSFSDAEANIIRAPFSENFPLEIMNKLSFTENEGKTTLIMRGGPINATEEEHKFFEGMYDSMKQGFGGTFDQLDAYLAKVV